MAALLLVGSKEIPFPLLTLNKSLTYMESSCLIGKRRKQGDYTEYLYSLKSGDWTGL